jgi:hypothetical protein
MFDPHTVHVVPLDVHANDIAGVQTDFVDVAGQLHATSLPATTHLHLGLDDDWVPNLFGNRYSFIDSFCDVAVTDGDAESGKVLLSLIFE